MHVLCSQWTTEARLEVQCVLRFRAVLSGPLRCVLLWGAVCCMFGCKEMCVGCQVMPGSAMRSYLASSDITGDLSSCQVESNDARCATWGWVTDVYKCQVVCCRSNADL